MEFPAVDHRFDLGEAPGCDDRHHSLLRLGDHDLPGLHPVLTLRHAVEMHVDAVVGGHLGERGRKPGCAAILQRQHETPFDELDRDLDQALAGERIAHLDRRTLVGGLLAELLACENGCPADSVTSGGRTVENEHGTSGVGSCAHHACRRAAGRRTSR